MKNLIPQIDHLVYAVEDLDKGIAYFSQLTGVQPVIGGKHHTEGTWNALFGLGHNSYFEIIAPDPAQDPPKRYSWRDAIAVRGYNRLVRWCAVSNNLEQSIRKAKALHVDVGEAIASSRKKTDGSTLSWTLSDLRVDPLDGVFPFFIDWGSAAHPSQSLPQGCTIRQMEALHPEPPFIQTVLEKMEIPLPVYQAAHPQLIVMLNTPNGAITIK